MNEAYGSWLLSASDRTTHIWSKATDGRELRDVSCLQEGSDSTSYAPMCSQSAPSSMTRLHSWLRLPMSDARTDGAMMLHERRRRRVEPGAGVVSLASS
jgi:hypothetical protein